MRKTLVPSAYDFLSEQQKKLVDAYIDPANGFDQQIALEIAGYDKYSNTRSSKSPFKVVGVRRAIAEKLKPSFDREGITFEENFKYVASLAYGDVNELVEVLKVNCRYCNGRGHQYQWTEAEYKKELNKAIADFIAYKELPSSTTQDELEDLGMLPPSLEGGFDFDPYADPHPDCPECGGRGEDRLYIHPQFISHPLYAGAEVDKNGNIKINIRNQDNALKLLSQLAGFLVERVEVKEVVTADELAKRRKRAQERRMQREEK